MLSLINNIATAGVLVGIFGTYWFLKKQPNKKIMALSLLFSIASFVAFGISSDAIKETENQDIQNTAETALLETNVESSSENLEKEIETTFEKETNSYESPVRIIGQYFNVDSDEYIKQSDNVFLEKERDFVEYTLDQASNVERVKVNFDLFALDEELDADLINGHIYDYLPKDSEEVSSSETLERDFKSIETNRTYKVVYTTNEQGITALEISKK